MSVMTDKATNRLLTLPEIAQRFNCSVKTFERKARLEGIPYQIRNDAMCFDPYDVFDHFDDNNILRNQDISKHNHAGGSVYLLTAYGTGYFKIGYSLLAVGRRIKQLQAGCPFELLLRATRSGDMRTESNLHYYFCQHRVKGRSEWFESGYHWSHVTQAFISWDVTMGEEQWK